MKKLVFIFFLMPLLFNACQSYKALSINNLQGFQLSPDTYNKPLLDSLKSKIRDNTFKEINSIIVLKDGKLLIEEYFNGASREQTHDARSVGKTFAATMLGIAIQEGHIISADQTLSEFYDLKKYKNFDPKKGNISLKNLMTMSSNFNGNDMDENSIGNEENMYPTPNWVEWTLNLPLDSSRKSGASWHYFTAGAVLLGDVLHQKVPNGLENYTREKLFTPLSISNFKWQFTPQKVANTAGGLQLTPLDFAKFGQLYKNGGTWQGKQILPESWVKASLSRQIEVPFDGMGYGYFMWNRLLKSNNKSYDTYNCLGNGGNRIVVIPETAFVIVVTASAYNKPYGHQQVDDILTKYVLPAIDGK
jgi:CubicO group peptidase (beta-lactamase class C family)